MLEETFLAMGEWPVSKAIGESLWIFPLVQAFHLVALAFFAGAIVIVDLRLLGFMKEQPVNRIARDARPWLIWSFVALVVTGFPQMIQNASREYYSEFFWYKMYLLGIALVFTFTIRWWITQKPTAGGAAKVVGVLSMAMWAGVAIFARLIGLFT